MKPEHVWRETQKMIDEAKRDAPDIWAKVAVERILESGSSQLMPSASATSVKTLASRFAYVSSEITCPSGCAGLTRHAAIVAGDQYVVRDPVRVNYELPVQLKDGREEIAEFFKEAADMVDFSWEFLTARQA
eukprot:g1758.t1